MPSYLLLNQFFWPDQAPTSVLLSDVARALIGDGGQVTAIAAGASYSAGEDTCAPGARVIRSSNARFTRGASLNKLFSYLSYSAICSWRAVRLARHDVVVCLTTPPFLSTIGLAVKYLRGSRLVIWEMDVYPDIAIDVGVLSDTSLIGRFLYRWNRFVRNRADTIIALGADMRGRLIASGTRPELITVAENWADAEVLRPAAVDSKGPVRLLYSGNLGLAHDVATIEAAVHQLSADKRVRFVFAGGGHERPKLERRCRAAQLPNVDFLPFCSRGELQNQLADSHIGVVTQKNTTLGSVVPSKVYGLLAVGRPILYIGPACSTPARIIERFGCGWHIQPGDVEGLTTLLRRLASEASEIVRAGDNARQAFENRYDVPHGVARVHRILARQAGLGPSQTMFRIPSLRVSLTLMLVWAAYVVALITGSVSPASAEFTAALHAGGDGLNHFLSFALLVFVPAMLLSFRRHRGLCVVAIMLLGFALELGRALTPGHLPEANVIITDCFGATIGWMVAKFSLLVAGVSVDEQKS